jgi:hypothetical protein
MCKRTDKMKKNIALLGFLITFLVSGFKSNAQIIISEYFEGTGNNKCIELYNPTPNAIDLTTYSLKIYFNGSSTAGTDFNLAGTINSCQTYVICNSAATAPYTAIADETNGGISFNGDDAIGIYNGGTLVDLFGEIGFDPGVEWTDVAPGTSDGAFIRNANYCTPVTTNPATFDSFTAANWTSVSIAGTGDLGSHTTTCCLTVSVGAINTSPFSVTCSAGDNGTVDFTSTGHYNSGNTYSVELSDASGNFTTGQIIGTLISTANSGSISITIPSGSATSSSYKIRVNASSNSVTGQDNGPAFTINLTETCTLPFMRSVIINSCNTTCDEGNNEVVFGNTGDYAVNATSANIDLGYGSIDPPTVRYTESLTTNATTTGDLNTLAGCPGLFIDATGTTIPKNSSFAIVRSTICPEALDWSSLCGSGPIYIIYTTDVDWNTNGNFTNSTSCGGMRYFETIIKTTDNQTSTISYSFDCTLQSSSDGSFVTYSSAGGAPTFYGNDNCTLNPILLPIEWSRLTGKTDLNGIQLSWETYIEENLTEFKIMHSSDGKTFHQIASLPPKNLYSNTTRYNYYDETPNFGINYYKLIAIDFDGKENKSNIVSLQKEKPESWWDSESQQIVFSKPTSGIIYNAFGGIIMEFNDVSEIPFFLKGIFIIQNKETGKITKLCVNY